MSLGKKKDILGLGLGSVGVTFTSADESPCRLLALLASIREKRARESLPGSRSITDHTLIVPAGQGRTYHSPWNSLHCCLSTRVHLLGFL